KSREHLRDEYKTIAAGFHKTNRSANTAPKSAVQAAENSVRTQNLFNKSKQTSTIRVFVRVYLQGEIKTGLANLSLRTARFTNNINVCKRTGDLAFFRNNPVTPECRKLIIRSWLQAWTCLRFRWTAPSGGFPHRISRSIGSILAFRKADVKA
ncbi:MAG: hypothetical protein ACKPHU_22575, partial [Planctomycetaceae bacterium]